MNIAKVAKFCLVVLLSTALFAPSSDANWSQVNQELEEYPALKMAVLEAISRKHQLNIENARKLELKVYSHRRFATLTFWFVSSRAGYESLWTMLCKEVLGSWACSLSRE